MWALVESNSDTKAYTRPTAITVGFVAATYYTENVLYVEGDELPYGKSIGDIKYAIGDLKTPRLGTNYPANIMSMWTASELEAIGIYEVVQDNTNLKDSRYYYNTLESFTFADGIVTKSFGVATAQAVNDILWTQADIDSMDPAPEGVSVGDLRERGLKYIHKIKINNSANELLRQYDWYTLRAASGGTAVPSAVSTYQAAIRTKSNEHATAINAVANVDALAALTFDRPNTP